MTNVLYISKIIYELTKWISFTIPSLLMAASFVSVLVTCKKEKASSVHQSRSKTHLNGSPMEGLAQADGVELGVSRHPRAVSNTRRQTRKKDDAMTSKSNRNNAGTPKDDGISQDSFNDHIPIVKNAKRTKEIQRSTPVPQNNDLYQTLCNVDTLSNHESPLQKEKSTPEDQGDGNGNSKRKLPTKVVSAATQHSQITRRTVEAKTLSAKGRPPPQPTDSKKSLTESRASQRATPVTTTKKGNQKNEESETTPATRTGAKSARKCKDVL